MATHSLDQTFRALASPTRRAVVERLTSGPATVSELAEPFDIALPSFMQHLQTLEDCGLIVTRKKGRTRIVRVQTQRLKRASAWLAKQQELWETRLNQLETYAKNIEKE